MTVSCTVCYNLSVLWVGTTSEHSKTVFLSNPCCPPGYEDAGGEDAGFHKAMLSIAGRWV